MGRPRLLHPTSDLRFSIDGDLHQRLDALLYSDLEERVPYGAYRKFFEILITRALTHRELDLAPFLDCPAGIRVVRGDKESIEQLKRILEVA